METAATCLDRLQSDAKAYMGILLPNLQVMKMRLEMVKEAGNLKHAAPLVNHLLEQPRLNKGFAYRY